MSSSCAIQRNRFATPEAAWTTGSLANTGAGSVEKKGVLVCPKPRRLSFIQATADASRAIPFWWRVSTQQQEDCDSKAGNELLEIILSKDGNSDRDNFLQDIASSSPAIFSGSPPSRVSNPLIQDARFGEEKFTTPVSPTPSGLAPIRVRTKFGTNPALRIEGFDCLDNKRNSSIPALA